MPGANSIVGLASNLDTTAIIDAMIAADRQPALFMERDKAWKSLEITKFKALSARLLALQSSINALNDERGFSQASIQVSNSNILTASAESAIGTGTYTLNVDSLAKNHQIASQGYTDVTSALLGTGTTTISIGDDNPTTIELSEDNNSLIGLKNAINDANIGITASIINDGSASKSYRLVLSGNETGAQETISFSSSLTGGEAPDFINSSFDNPETTGFSVSATSQVSLGATSSFTGATNKAFTFTIAGTGTQTVGSGDITIDWTDGTDSGSIVVSQADTEIIGPEGLKLSFADGDLVAGDTFTVSTFAPLLQKASDAQVSMGSSDGGASPIIINSKTNTVKDIITGLTVELKNITTAETGPVIISTGLDTSAIRSKLNSFINAYNDVMEFIDKENSFNSDTEEGGVLMGDVTVQMIQSRLSGLIINPIVGLDKSMSALSAIGIRVDQDGKLALKSSSKLTSALKEDFEAVMRLFVDGGDSDNTGISFLSTSPEITGGSEFEIDITQAATHGYYQGGNISDPSTTPISLTSSNNKIQLRIDGRVSEVMTLTAREYSSSADLVNEIQTRINNDKNISAMGVTAEWVDTGSGKGYIKLTSSSYGSASKAELMTSIPNSAYADLGLSAGTLHAGLDVAGTINGESATGQGQVLTGDEDNVNTAELQLKITLTEAQVSSAIEGNITITKGLASVLAEKLDNITKSGSGIIDTKTSSLEKQIENIDKQIKSLDERLAIRRESLVLEFIELEMVLSQLQTESAFLESQLEGIAANFAQMTGKK
ncbi:MAG: flagellar filament capping protein FliD [candidate division Zixibacteria bacterium]